MKIVDGKGKSEISEFPFFVLRGGRQHIIRLRRGFRHGDIDHHQQIQSLQSSFRCRGIGRRVGRIGAIDQHCAKTVRIVRQDLLRKSVRRIDAANLLHVRHQRSRALGVADQRLQPGVYAVGSRPAEVPRRQKQQVAEIGIQCRVASHLDTELGPQRHGLGFDDHLHSQVDVGFVQAGMCNPRGGGDLGDIRGDRIPPLGVFGDELPVNTVGIEQQFQHGAEQISVCTGFDLQMQIGEFRVARADRIDHDDLLTGRLLGFPQMRSRTRLALRLPDAAAQNDHEVRVFGLDRMITILRPEHPAVDPEAAGFFLGDGAVEFGRAERPHHHDAVAAAGMVTLAAAAVMAQRTGPVMFPDSEHLFGYFRQCGVPIDLLEAAVRAAPER